MTIWNDLSGLSDSSLDEAEKKLLGEVKQEYKKYRFLTEILVELVEGQKGYKIQAVVLTNEEYKVSLKK